MAREYPRGVSETDVAGWRPMPSHVVDTPSLADSPAHLECRVREVIHRGDHPTCSSGVHIMLAEVVCITAADSIMSAPGRIDPTRVKAVGRMGFPWLVAAEQESLFHQDRVSYAELNPVG